MALRRKLNFDRGSDSGLRSVAISKGNSPKNRSSRVRRGFKNARVTGFIRSRSRDAKRNPGDPLLVFESRIWNKDQRLVDRAAGNLSTNRDRACKTRSRRSRFFSARRQSRLSAPRAPAPRESAFEKRARLLLAPRKIVRRSVRKTPRASRLRQSRNPHFLARKRRSAPLLSARQNGRSLRCRPRPQQGPRGLHRQGRQHQLHDGVAAPRQQVRLPARPPRASPSNDESMLVLKYGFFPRSRLARAARRDRGVAPRRIGAERRPDPVDRSIVDRSSSRDRAFARTRERAAPSPDPTRAVFRSARSFSRRAYPIPLERAPFRARGGRGRLVPGRPRAERSRATVCGTPPRGCPRRRLEGSLAAVFPSLPRASASRNAAWPIAAFFPNAIGPFRRTRTPVSIDPRTRR